MFKYYAFPLQTNIIVFCVSFSSVHRNILFWTQVTWLDFFLTQTNWIELDFFWWKISRDGKISDILVGNFSKTTTLKRFPIEDISSPSHTGKIFSLPNVFDARNVTYGIPFNDATILYMPYILVSTLVYQKVSQSVINTRRPSSHLPPKFKDGTLEIEYF